MDRQGFIDFNTRLSPENSGKADSYARAIKILDEVLPYQDVIDLHGQSLYDVHDVSVIETVLLFVNGEVKKMKNNEQNIFDYGKPNQKSYPLKSFCSAALKSLKKYVQYEQEVMAADRIVAQETNPRTISKKLIAHFDLTKEGKDIASETKRRKGQEYFRRMILANYGGRCALTGIDIPQLLLASHIIPWAESTPQQKLSPENGICLSALYDKAFDKGLIGFDGHYRAVLSNRLKEHCKEEYYQQYFGCIDGKTLNVPYENYKPDLKFLEYHMDCIFLR